MQEKDGISLFRGFACEVATKQCVCGQRNMPATLRATTEDCGLSDSMCNVKTSFYSSSYSTQLCGDSVGQSDCLKNSLHDGTGTCTSIVNEDKNLVPACFRESLQVSKWQYDETVCLGYVQGLGNVQGGILMSETFVFPCSDIISFGQDYILACIRILLDSTVQNSILSYLTFNIHHTPGSGRRLLLDHSVDGVFGQTTDLLSVFMDTSVARIPQIESWCQKIMELCVQQQVLSLTNKTQHRLSEEMQQQCTHCARMWWMANYTLTTLPSNHHLKHLQFHVVDTDFLDIRNVILKLCRTLIPIPHVFKRIPRAISLLLHDWLRDDTLYEFIMRGSRDPMQVLDEFVYAFMCVVIWRDF